MSSSIVDIKNDSEAKAASLLDTSALPGKKNVLFFYAEWHEPSAAGGPFDMVVKALAGQSGTDGVNIYRVLAEEAPTLSQKVSLLTDDLAVGNYPWQNFWIFVHIMCTSPHHYYMHY